MVTRVRKVWKRRPDGQFDCQVGWKSTAGGNRSQHKFRLGPDEREARRRDLLLREMWGRIEEQQGADPRWTRDTLEVAKQVAQGSSVIQVQRLDGEEDFAYSDRVVALRALFPILQIYTEPEYAPALYVQMLDAYRQSQDDQVIQAEVERRQQEAQNDLRASIQGTPRPVEGPTLHEALRAYSKWIEEEFARPEGGIKPWGRTQQRQVETLLAHHKDLPLGCLDRAHVEAMIRYWRKRPFVKGVKQKIKNPKRVEKSSATNCIKALRAFFRWLDESEDFAWKSPKNLNRIRGMVEKLEDEASRRITPEQVFTLNELVLLYKYGTPLDRLLILLGMNCGFAAAESSTLLVGEIFLFTPHPARHQEIFDFHSTEDDSFIKRVRRKNGVYGEFLLFKQTVAGFKWAIQQRKKQPNYGKKARLLLNGNGRPFDTQTEGGNPNQEIPNMFNRLLGRIEKDGEAITRLPFKTLRKTAGDLVKRFSDNTTKLVFHCRGRSDPDDEHDDAYTTRQFGKVFVTLRKIEEYLQPMFEAAGPEPFRPQSKASKYTVQRIVELHEQNVAPAEIAKEVGRSIATVYRHLPGKTEPRRHGEPQERLKEK